MIVLKIGTKTLDAMIKKQSWHIEGTLLINKENLEVGHISDEDITRGVIEITLDKAYLVNTLCGE